MGDREGLLSPDIKYDQESAFKWFEANIVSSWVRLNSFSLFLPSIGYFAEN